MVSVFGGCLSPLRVVCDSNDGVEIAVPHAISPSTIYLGGANNPVVIPGEQSKWNTPW